MKRVQSSLFLFLLLLIIPNCVHAQAWSGIIAPSRAVDWSQAGTSIVEPTVQCGSTIAAGGTLGSPMDLNAAIYSRMATCSPNTYIQLGTGTFYTSTGFSFYTGASACNAVGYRSPCFASFVQIRGMGANLTYVYLVGSSLGAGSYTNTAFSIEGSSTSPISPVNVCDWTSGYSKGTTTIQIANCGSTTPALGALSNLQVGSLIVLDQVDPVADNATAWNCAANYTDRKR